MINDLNTAIAANGTALGFPILESNLQALYDDTPYTDTTQTSSGLSSNQVVGIVLGFAIAIFVLAILIPVFVWIRRGRTSTTPAELEKNMMYKEQ
jgi:hypothetical protein